MKSLTLTLCMYLLVIAAPLAAQQEGKPAKKKNSFVNSFFESSEKKDRKKPSATTNEDTGNLDRVNPDPPKQEQSTSSTPRAQDEKLLEAIEKVKSLQERIYSEEQGTQAEASPEATKAPPIKQSETRPTGIGKIDEPARRTKYVPRPIVSLVASASSETKLLKHLEQFTWLAKHRNIIVGDIIIVGFKDIEEVAKATMGMQAKDNQQKEPKAMTMRAVAEQTKKIGLSVNHFTPLDKLLSRMQIEHSPTWVVRNRGNDYILEGIPGIRKYFSKDGTFHAPR